MRLYCVILHRMKRIAVIFALFFLLSLGAAAQYFYAGPGFSLPRTKFVADSSGNMRFQPGDIGFTIQAGAFAGSNFQGGNWFGTSLSPAIAYNISPRFRLKAGVSITQGFGDSYYRGYDRFYYPVNTAGTTTSVFVQGDYILSDKLMLSGAVYKYFSPYNIQVNDPRFKDPEGEGLLFNINYRPTRNLEINASFDYGRGNRFYNPSPFYQPSPFYNDPFRP